MAKIDKLTTDNRNLKTDNGLPSVALAKGGQVTTILVTGGAGYIGSVLVPLLLDKGYRVKVVDALIYNQNSPVIWIQQPNYQFIKGDLRVPEVLKDALKDVDLIIHLAALVGEGVCRENPGLSYDLNTGLVEKINDQRGNTPIITMSTTSVYGETGGGICDEMSDPGPFLPYALNKFGAEKIIRKSKNYIILRPATAFGFSPRARLDLLPNDFTYKAVKLKYLDVYAPDVFRTFIHVKDLALIIIEMMKNFDRLKNQIYNAGSDELNFSKRELVKVIRSKTDFKLKIVEDYSDPDKRNFIVNYDKLKRAINYQPEYSLKKGISELVRAYQDFEADQSCYNSSIALKDFLSSTYRF